VQLNGTPAESGPSHLPPAGVPAAEGGVAELRACHLPAQVEGTLAELGPCEGIALCGRAVGAAVVAARGRPQGRPYNAILSHLLGQGTGMETRNVVPWWASLEKSMNPLWS
jgi:hypothetical protein